MCCKVWIDQVWVLKRSQGQRGFLIMGFLMQKWKDEYIHWKLRNGSDHRPDWMAFKPGEIWTPDIAIDNRYSNSSVNCQG